MSASSTQALDYLESLPGVDHKKLYQLPSTVLAVFRRLLPHLAKTIVAAMLYMPGPLAATDLDAWIRPDAKAEKEQAVTLLQGLHILSIDQEIPSKPVYRLSPIFAKSLRQALTGGGNHRSFGIPCNTPETEKKDITFLDDYARQQWEAILYYMVASTGAGLRSAAEISTGTKILLSTGNFVTNKNSRVSITQVGFTFLLQEVNAQIWSLLVVYLNNAKSLQMEHVDIISFLFMLGSLELGQDYSAENLTPTQKHMLDDLNDFGIVYRPSPSSPVFYPTRLATTLTSDGSALSNTSLSSTPTSAPAAGKGYIIIETNYRLYAYTSSVLQIAVLNLFTKLKTRYPNLVAGQLTKSSVQRAIGYGITSDQIISYLATHAHPQMAKSNPVLPPTVVDQIRLWQIEGDRMKATHGYLLKEFGSKDEYADAVAYAGNLGVLVWKNDVKRVFFVNRIEQMKTYMTNKAAAVKKGKD
ncbi:putative TFIIH and nucleotide excision repair factor 3 complexes subunit [Pseudovirgaria hyperparasitica]|uniref:RNA polymerase II transcription factor B subunit 2 n=1 Tax=Pseudovirgaria hyperparasitica TaxID=470096 RepID=A0A6A6WEH9_9PEZI|nr:putative TFIIH and nucleotide excision repair factor 3 complexes subunit [Pseudovirgaria hyperparasitica]KAF2761123.1 putative TFIIH and nucleotide excision repair factor 3 complexes subunit [Pseudovirgaria hyperparasitica]